MHRSWSATPRGISLGVVGLVGGLVGLALHERQIVRVAAFLILLSIVAAVLLASGRRRLRAAAELSAPRVEAGRDVELRLTVSSTGRLPTASLGISLALPDGLSAAAGRGGVRTVIAGPRPERPATLAIGVHALVRGRYQIPAVTVETSDALGLCRLRRPETAVASLTVLPHTERLRGALPATGTVTHGSGGSRATGTAGDPDMNVREYRSGDDRRRVHWRSSARLGELMVRGEEQQRQAAVTVLLDTRAAAHRRAGAHGSFEWAVAASASLTRHLLGAGHQVRLVGAPGRDPAPAVRAPGARAVAELERLVDARAAGDRRREHPVGEILPPADRSVLVAVFGALTTADLSALRAARAGRPDALALLLDVDSWVVGNTAADAADRRHALDALAGSLRRAGWRTAVVGRDSTVGAAWSSLVRSGPGSVPLRPAPAPARLATR